MPFQFLTEFPAGTRGNTCTICNLSRREADRIIDPFIQIDFEGYVMFCETCVAEMARMIGFIDPAKAEKLSEKAQRADVAVADLHAQLEDRNELVSLLKKANTFLTAEAPLEPDMPTDAPASRPRAKATTRA